MDAVIAELDRALRICTNTQLHSSRSSPESALEPPVLSAVERRRSAALMRVNHAGEIAAQALYRGQANFARSSATRELLHQSAEEEVDHLQWCRERLDNLDSSVSALTPLWYAGSFAIGTLAGLAGDAYSLGFVQETEKQVAEHLEGHLQKLPKDDTASRAVVEQMRLDELEHGAQAQASGARALPRAVAAGMRWTARVMTALAARF